MCKLHCISSGRPYARHSYDCVCDREAVLVMDMYYRVIELGEKRRQFRVLEITIIIINK